MKEAGRIALLGLCIIVFVCAAAPAVFASAAADGQNDKIKPWDGSRTTPVHLIPLRDELNEPIIPTELQPMPFSARNTCGPCHSYAAIQSGLHFDAMTSGVSGRPGEPWIWLDGKTGTILPVSYRKWPGSWNPKELGIGAWDFTQLFGRHFPGGGPAEPGDAETTSDPAGRWNVAGKAEVNCLACHNKSGRQDPSEWAKQILRQNLRWAATAAGGVAEVGGMASRLHDSWNVVDGPNLDDHEWAVAPFVKYRTVDFDSKHRYFFELDYKPDDSRCLACHSEAAVGEVRAHSQADVHTARGLKCVDCHTNGIAHGMIRGYEGEAAETGNAAADSFTCRGCHLGEDPSGERLVRPGRLGAPYPKHKGMPLVHFRTLACTTCHSGPLPDKTLTRVRTSRANRLGIHGVAQWSTDLPAVMEPVYVKDARDKVGPQRLVWPAFWAKLEGKDVKPLQPGTVEAAAGDILKPEEHIAAVLSALSQAAEEGETPVLAAGEFVFEVNVDGGLDATERPKDQEAKGAKRSVGANWAIRKGGTMAPLIPDFDPASPEKDAAIEPKIQSILQALGMVAGAPGKPAVLVRKTLYQITDGNLASADAPAGFEGAGIGWLKGAKLEPLASDFDVRTVTTKAGTEQTLTEEQVGLILKALSDSAAKLPASQKGQSAAKAAPGAGASPGNPMGGAVDDEEGRAGAVFGYVSGGRLFTLGRDGKLADRKHEAASPVTWPLAHNVRPVQQSLGWNGCTDCHSANSRFFFTVAKGTGPLLTKAVATKSGTSFMGVGSLYHRIFGLTFAVRPFSKIVLGLAILVTGALLLAFFLLIVGKVAGFIEKRY